METKDERKFNFISLSADKPAEELQRPYKCACGKSYLSSPALYTHVKIKHKGIAPGPLTKPTHPPTNTRKRDRRPGKTATFPNAIQQDSDCAINIADEASKLIMGVEISYDGKFQSSFGEETCQDMATKFLGQLVSLQQAQIAIINCFLNSLKQYMNSHVAPAFWETQPPQKIVLSANQFIRDYDNNKWLIDKRVITDLIYLLCKWMDRRRWTTSKLIKRNPPNVVIV